MGQDTPYNPDNFPPAEVRDSLMRLRLQTKDTVAKANGEYGDRVKNFYQLYPDFTPKAYRVYDGIMTVFETNEIRAREELRLARKALDIAEADMDRRGHTGDLAEMAKKPAEASPKKPAVEASGEQTSNVMPLDQARKAFAKTADKAPTPAEPDAKAAKRKADRQDSVDAIRETLKREKGGKGGKKPASTVEQLAATAAEGDAHIKAVAAEMPDIPPELDRRARPEREPAPQPNKADFGGYRITS